MVRGPYVAQLDEGMAVVELDRVVERPTPDGGVVAGRLASIVLE